SVVARSRREDQTLRGTAHAASVVCMTNTAGHNPPHMTLPDAAPAPGRFDRLRRYYEHNERWVDIAFFAGGFVFDVATLSRVDAWINIAQQVIDLGVAGAIL